MNVPPGYARGHDPRGFGQLNVLLGYARGHGPQRFGHVNVGGSVGSVGPPTNLWRWRRPTRRYDKRGAPTDPPLRQAGMKVQSATVSNTNRCSQHSAPVR